MKIWILLASLSFPLTADASLIYVRDGRALTVSYQACNDFDCYARSDGAWTPEPFAPTWNQSDQHFTPPGTLPGTIETSIAPDAMHFAGFYQLWQTIAPGIFLTDEIVPIFSMDFRVDTDQAYELVGSGLVSFGDFSSAGGAYQTSGMLLAGQTYSIFAWRTGVMDLVLVPEPSPLALLAFGLVLGCAWRRREIQ
jgi:PEP-CTERM motif